MSGVFVAQMEAKKAILTPKSVCILNYLRDVFVLIVMKKAILRILLFITEIIYFLDSESNATLNF